MKSIVRTIMVLAVFGLAMGSFAPAQDTLEEAPEEAVTETEPAVSTPRSVPLLGSVPLTTFFVEPPSLGARGEYVTQTLMGGDRKVLIIPAEEVKVEDLTAIWQDLYVMSRIFDNKFSKSSRLVREVFPDFGPFFGRDNRDTEAIYLQGYGALFLMEANFPLTAPTKTKEKEAKKIEAPADPTWQRAKQKIFSPRVPTGWRTDPGEKYDAEQIEEVKRELIKSLKHAANIRNLKPDEWVILTVTGAGRQPNEVFEYEYGRLIRPDRATGSAFPGGTFQGGYGSGRGGYGHGAGYGGGGYGTGYSEMGSSSATVLTIRAKKSDVDAFAKGELDFDKFREKVQLFSYPDLGQNVGQVRRTTQGRSRTRVLPTPADEPIKAEPPRR